MRTLSTAVLAIAFLIPLRADACLLVNGDFETGDLTGWGGFGEIVNFNVYGGGPPSWALRVHVESGIRTITQSVFMNAGGVYAISWEEGRHNAGGNTLPLTSTVRVTVGGDLLHQSNNGGMSPGAYSGVQETKLYHPTTTGMHQLKFEFFYGGGSSPPSTLHMYLDNVAVEPDPVVITQHPASQVVCEGGTAIFDITTTGNGALTYEWRKDGEGIPGATQPSFTITPVSPSDAGTYDVVVSNNICSTVTSNPATLSVTVSPPLTIISHPASISTCEATMATFNVEVAGPGPLSYQWRHDGVPISGATDESYTIDPVLPSHAGEYDAVVANGCTSATSDTATLTVEAEGTAIHYFGSTLCEPAPVSAPGLLSFTYDGISPDYGCDGSVDSRLFAGQLSFDISKITKVRQDCLIHPFGALLCKPESVLIDVNGSWPGACSMPNLIIVGGLCNDGFDRVYFLDPVSGGICQEYVDNTLLHVGQMAIDSTGRLFVASVEGDCLNMLTEGVVWPFYCAPGQSPRAVAVDQDDNVHVTYAGDGVLRVIAPDGTPINETFAAGLEGAVSQAIAPTGIFHGNLFVACGDRVMEVDLMTGHSSVFLACTSAHGIAFDPEGYMHVSVPSEDHILKIGSALPGDMNGSGTVDLDDLPGFVAALLRLHDAPLPIMTADMDGDGCANGLDIRVFVETLIGP